MTLATQQPHRFGLHRVREPAGALPQSAWKLDNSPSLYANEIRCEVEVLNVDSCSFKELRDTYCDDPERISVRILEIVRERGKLHNPQTGSGGMFIGKVAAIGDESPARSELKIGDRVASLVSLTLTPLHLESIETIDLETGRIRATGSATLFESSRYAKLPDDIETNVALAILDVAGAPAQTARMVKAGMIVAVIGADGKSGLLSSAQARTKGARVFALVPDAGTAGAEVLRKTGIAEEIIEVDARDALGLFRAFEARMPALADLTINCVNVAGTEAGSILCTHDGGTVYFFSMCTSFTAAALGAEGLGKDVTMIIGNGYAPDHADIALQTLRSNPELHHYFRRKYGERP